MDDNDIKRPLVENEEELEKNQDFKMIEVAIPTTIDVPEPLPQENSSKLEQKKKISVKYIYFTVLIFTWVSILSGFALNLAFYNFIKQNIESNHYSMIIKSSYVSLLISGIISVIIFKGISDHINSNLKKYEIGCLGLYICFLLIGSWHIGHDLGYLNLAYAYVLRLLFVLVLYLHGEIEALKELDAQRFIVQIVLGFTEAFLFKFSEVSLEFYILGILFSGSNIVVHRVQLKFKIFEKAQKNRSIFCYLVLVSSIAVNGPIIYYLTKISIMINDLNNLPS